MSALVSQKSAFTCSAYCSPLSYDICSRQREGGGKREKEGQREGEKRGREGAGTEGGVEEGRWECVCVCMCEREIFKTALIHKKDAQTDFKKRTPSYY